MQLKLRTYQFQSIREETREAKHFQELKHNPFGKGVFAKHFSVLHIVVGDCIPTIRARAVQQAFAVEFHEMSIEDVVVFEHREAIGHWALDVLDFDVDITDVSFDTKPLLELLLAYPTLIFSVTDTNKVLQILDRH